MSTHSPSADSTAGAVEPPRLEHSNIDPPPTVHVVPQIEPCTCIEVDRDALAQALAADLSSELANAMVSSTSSWFSRAPVFVAKSQLDEVRYAVGVLWRAVHRLAAHRDSELGLDLEGPSGVLHGFDFHLTPHGPRLIEMNTNAGGALLALRLSQAQVACCDEVAQRSTDLLQLATFESALVEMFRREWQAARRVRQSSDSGAPGEPLRTIAIVDEDPPSQGLFPEMQLFRALFERAGIEAVVADPRELQSDTNGGLVHGDRRLDLVYNRLCDFQLVRPEHAALRRAWEEGRVVLTPHPRIYTALADKRRLLDLRNQPLLEQSSVSASDRRWLERLVPTSSAVTHDNAEELWEKRKSLFFKPFQGYGSRGAFDGRKLTRRTFESFFDGSEDGVGLRFLAQERVEPSRIDVEVDGRSQQLKVDLRAVVYQGEVAFFLARLYRGQTTNLRTLGGGLATVFPAPG